MPNSTYTKSKYNVILICTLKTKFIVVHICAY